MGPRVPVAASSFVAPESTPRPLHWDEIRASGIYVLRRPDKTARAVEVVHFQSGHSWTSLDPGYFDGAHWTTSPLLAQWEFFGPFAAMQLAGEWLKLHA